MNNLYLQPIVFCFLLLTSMCQSAQNSQEVETTRTSKERIAVERTSTQSNELSEEAKKTLVERSDAQGIASPNTVVVGAAQFHRYELLLKGKNVGMVVNQTSTVDDQHLVDVLLQRGISVKKVFAPEHGFRGKADAGEKVVDGKDPRTGLPIISLYGKNKKPSVDHLAGLDILVFDIQDVGARFYTYISTMHYVMEACAEQGLPVLVLDRPNPNGHYVDGPIREEALSSFVGMHPIPIVHGMTVAELARMINGEGWLKNGVSCDLQTVSCVNYNRQDEYVLPVKPSPNLPNNLSIYLYPSLCLFEGTTVSVGRGTDKQFQIMGAPFLKGKMPDEFTPVPKEGAKYPKHQDKVCYGLDLSSISHADVRANGFDLAYLLKAYELYPDKSKFFNENNFFDKLAGTYKLREQIKAGTSYNDIKASWEPALSEFKQKRAAYLLYD